MKEFDVTITETLRLTVSVEASSKEEAQQSWNSRRRKSGSMRTEARCLTAGLP